MQKSTPLFRLMTTYLDFFFYGTQADARPAYISAASTSPSMPSKSVFPSSPIYRQLAWMDLSYGAMEIAWDYASRLSPWVDPILRARYTAPYPTFVLLAEEWETSVRTISYWHQKGSVAFLESYSQQTRTALPWRAGGVWSLEMSEYLDRTSE